MPISKKKRSAISKNNRKKGHQFERDVAQLFREAFPHLAEQIKRTVQSSGGGAQEGSDFRFPNLWPECQLARTVTPHAKLQQAISDMAAKGERKLPVAICRELGARTSFAYLRNEHWIFLTGNAWVHPEFASVIVRVELGDFIQACAFNKLDTLALPPPMTKPKRVAVRR